MIAIRLQQNARSSGSLLMIIASIMSDKPTAKKKCDYCYRIDSCFCVVTLTEAGRANVF